MVVGAVVELTTTVKVDVAKLVPSVAVTTWVTWAAATVGVPDTTPVAVLSESPAGSAGDTENVLVPVTVGAANVDVAAIAVPISPEID